MEACLVHLLTTILAIPPQPVDAVLRPVLLQDYAHGVCEPNGIMGRVGREEEHVALVDADVAKLAIIDDLEEHAALVLVEPFGGLVDVVICAGVGTADDHDGDGIIVNTVVVDGRLEHVGVFRNPGGWGVSKSWRGWGQNDAVPFGDVYWRCQ